jgi:hypothetical protein
MPVLLSVRLFAALRFGSFGEEVMVWGLQVSPLEIAVGRKWYSATRNTFSHGVLQLRGMRLDGL